jgi:hypothetical protein
MSHYYYFAATLPSLQYGLAPAIPYEEFIERASRNLNPGDFAAVAGATLGLQADGSIPESAAGVKLLESYYRRELAVRNELVRLRAQRLHKQADAYLKPGDADWESSRVALAAFGAETPLDGELTLEKERWNYLDGMSTNHFFDLDYLAAYALKLLSLTRRHRFQAQAGEEGYKTVYRSVLDTADYRNESGDTL